MITITNPDQTQKELSLEDLLSQANYTILYFYPKDNTPGCTLEAQDFRSLSAEFDKLGAQIIWISKDNHKSHCKFIQGHDLNFQLISDIDLELHNRFQTMGEKSMFGKKYMGTIRSTFLVNSKAEILAERRNVSASSHAKNVLEKMQEVVMDRK